MAASDRQRKDTGLTVIATRGTAMPLPVNLKRSPPNCSLTVTADAEPVISVRRREGFSVALV
jgi:hypothetical protein